MRCTLDSEIAHIEVPIGVQRVVDRVGGDVVDAFARRIGVRHQLSLAVNFVESHSLILARAG